MLQYCTKLRDDGTLEIYVNGKLFTKSPNCSDKSEKDITDLINHTVKNIVARETFNQKNNYAEFIGEISVKNGLVTASDTMHNDKARIKDIQITKGDYECYTISHFKKHCSKVDCCIVLKNDGETYEKIKNNKSWREYDKTKFIDVSSGFIGFLVNCDKVPKNEWRNLAKNPLLKHFCTQHNNSICFGITTIPNHYHTPAEMRHLYVIRNKNQEITALKIKN